MIRLSWDVHYLCPYRCPYCRYFPLLNKEHHRYRSVKEIREIWRRVSDKYGETELEIAGGEPMGYPNFVAIIEALSEMHLLTLHSNLSNPQVIREFAERVSPERVELRMNFHPQFASLDRFIRRALLMKMKAFRGAVSIVAYPAFFKDLDYYKKRFQEKKIECKLIPFRGDYAGKSYPEGYAEAEKEKFPQEYGFDKTSKKGRNCRAGQRYACIGADGNVYRCREEMEKFEPLGNIFNGNLNLYPRAKSCRSDFCSEIGILQAK